MIPQKLPRQKLLKQAKVGQTKVASTNDAPAKVASAKVVVTQPSYFSSTKSGYSSSCSYRHTFTNLYVEAFLSQTPFSLHLRSLTLQISQLIKTVERVRKRFVKL